MVRESTYSVQLVFNTPLLPLPLLSCGSPLFPIAKLGISFYLLASLPRLTARLLSSSSKQQQRTRQFLSLKSTHSSPFTVQEEHVFSLTLAEIVTSCSSGDISPSVVRDTYLKRTVVAHEATNCISDFLSDNHSLPSIHDSLPLLGVPISIKDSLDIQGHDTTLGYSRNVNRPAASSSVMVDMLLSAGATLHVKTTVPTGLLDLETGSDLYGYTPNPYSSNHSAGASTGGGAALLAYGGSKIEIGSDIGGSVRLPAHFCGIYGIKASTGRFPETGAVTPASGLQAIHTVTSPMAKDLDDLEEFCHRFVDLKPWEHDHMCVPVPWRPFSAENKTFKFGVIWNDGVIAPSPACLRALKLSVGALKQQGHEVVDFSPPSPLEGLKLGYRFAFAVGAKPSFEPLSPGERINDAMQTAKILLALPLFIKKFVAYLLRTLSRPDGRNEAWASLLEVFHPCTVSEERQMVIEKDLYAQEWHRRWSAEQLDFILTVPFATPAIPKGSTGKATLIAAAYCYLWNFLDYSAGVLPVTFVDRNVDALPQDFKRTSEYARMNDVSQGIFSLYDADAMHGLPVGVQVVGRRFEEEKVLGGMKLVRAALAAAGNIFKQRSF